jgi:hypothetical protein|tara:strand:+ start:8163 stop:8525 length:363 start_codon:yes stop_codon:yes gene_type:complete
MTQKETLAAVLSDIKHIKTHMPNGELKQMAKDFEKMKDDVADLKFTLLNPDDGVIVNTNKNTENRVFHENKAEIYNQNVIKLNELENWKIGVNRALWIIFGVLATVIIRMLIVHSEKLTQ